MVKVLEPSKKIAQYIVEQVVKMDDYSGILAFNTKEAMDYAEITDFKLFEFCIDYLSANHIVTRNHVNEEDFGISFNHNCTTFAES